MHSLPNCEFFMARNPQNKLSSRSCHITITQLSPNGLLMAFLNSMIHIFSGEFLVGVSFLPHLRLLSLSSLVENSFEDLRASHLCRYCHEIVGFDVVAVNPPNPQVVCLTTKISNELYHVCIIPILQRNQVQTALLFRSTRFMISAF